MSNLSELLPAGSSVKSADFVAQGTLASGVTVALRSDGKVEAITGQSGSVGTKVVFEAATATNIAITYDSANNKVVIVYQDAGNSYYGTAIVGTVSGTAITFGSAVVFLSSSTITPIIAFDSTNNKVVVSYYYNPGSGNQGQAIVGTVSGTSISFGSAVNMASSAPTFNTITYDSNVNRMVISYRDANNSDKGTSIVGTVSGTSISFGSPVVYNTANSVYNSSTFDSANNKVIIAYQDYGNNTYGSAIVGTVSGTSISFGTSVVFSNNVAVARTSTTFDSSLNKVVIAYTGASNHGYAAVGTVSGTSISFGTPVAFNSAGNTLYLSAVFDSVSNKIVISYRDDSVANSGTVITGTVSGTSISSFSGKQVYASSSTDIAAAFDVNANATVSAYYDGTNSNHGTASVTTTAFSNVSSYVGITDQAISSAATGKVVCKGGAITNTGLLPFGFSLGTAVAASSSLSSYTSTAFDSSNNKVVIAFREGSAGKAVVGTVSGNSISYGSAATFESSAIAWASATFDSNANKIVIAYRDDGNSSYGTAVVGTVSGTSISFGTPVVFAAANTDYISITFDSNLNKIVITYRDYANSSYGTAIVGTVSGTSISFGAEVVYNSGNSEYNAATFDSNSNKVVVAYNDGTVGNLGKAIVGTVSGTSISFGSEATFNATQSNYVSAGFDSNSNKVVVFYSDVVGGSCIVGTVSGTSISFGTETRVGTSTSTSFTGMSFDSVNNKMILVYRGYINSAYAPRIAIGTVSGTSITVSGITAFETNAAYCSPVYDSSANRTVIAYQTGTDPYPATGLVANLTNLLTPNTAYFVQDDGTISTTSSTTKAGTALSTTSLLLTG